MLASLVAEPGRLKSARPLRPSLAAFLLLIVSSLALAAPMEPREEKALPYEKDVAYATSSS